jgi:polyisoprenoid-binding protein YceI
MLRLSTLVLSTLLSTAAFAQDGEAPMEPEAATPPTTTYAVSASGSDLYVVIRNDTSASLSRLGHDHVIYASKFSGTVVWPNEDGQSCNIEIRVPVMSLTVDPPGTRDAAGLDDNTIDDGDKQSLSKNMWGKSQLDAKNHSDIVFKSTSCEGREGNVKVNGTLTVRGTAAPVTVTMNVTADGSSLSARGKFNTTHSALGMKPFSASFVGPRNAEKLSFSIRLRGKAS